MKQHIAKQCRNCLSEYSVSPCYVDRPFCSRQCSADYRSKLHVKPMCICRQCRHEFYRTPSKRGDFCSRQCKATFHARFHTRVSICRVCGTTMQRQKSKNSKYCSTECNLAHVAQRRTKKWELKSPSGTIYRPTNLSAFIRENPELFANIEHSKTPIEKRMGSSLYKCGEWLGWIMLKEPSRMQRGGT